MNGGTFWRWQNVKLDTSKIEDESCSFQGRGVKGQGHRNPFIKPRLSSRRTSQEHRNVKPFVPYAVPICPSLGQSTGGWGQMFRTDSVLRPCLHIGSYFDLDHSGSGEVPSGPKMVLDQLVVITRWGLHLTAAGSRLSPSAVDIVFMSESDLWPLHHHVCPE